MLQQDQEILSTISPDEIAGIEVYQQRLTVPTEFLNKNALCGVVVVSIEETAAAVINLYNARAASGEAEVQSSKPT